MKPILKIILADSRLSLLSIIRRLKKSILLDRKENTRVFRCLVPLIAEGGDGNLMEQKEDGKFRIFCPWSEVGDRALGESMQPRRGWCSLPRDDFQSERARFLLRPACNPWQTQFGGG